MTNTNKQVTFQANGKTWSTDNQTRNLMGEYRDAGNKYMVSVVFNLGCAFGKITEVK
jgi:hypothetical protein